MKRFKTYNKEQDLQDFEEDVTCLESIVKDESDSKEEKKEEKNENF